MYQHSIQNRLPVLQKTNKIEGVNVITLLRPTIESFWLHCVETKKSILTL